jgi:hypothetical protein
MEAAGINTMNARPINMPSLESPAGILKPQSVTATIETTSNAQSAAAM